MLVFWKVKDVRQEVPYARLRLSDNDDNDGDAVTDVIQPCETWGPNAAST